MDRLVQARRMAMLADIHYLKLQGSDPFVRSKAVVHTDMMRAEWRGEVSRAVWKYMKNTRTSKLCMLEELHRARGEQNLIKDNMALACAHFELASICRTHMGNGTIETFNKAYDTKLDALIKSGLE